MNWKSNLNSTYNVTSYLLINFRYAEAEAVLLENIFSENALDDDEFIKDFGEDASFVLMLLGKIAARTERNARAIEAWKKALKLNPFLWSMFEDLCIIGDQPNPQNIFQINSVDNILMSQGHNISNVENIILSNNTPNIETPDTYLTTPPQILGSFNTANNKALFTPDETPLAQSLCLSGIRPIRFKKDLHCGVSILIFHNINNLYQLKYNFMCLLLGIYLLSGLGSNRVLFYSMLFCFYIYC